MTRALVLGPATDTRRQLVSQLSALGLSVIALQQLARKDLERVRGARVVVFCQCGAGQYSDLQQLSDYGLALAIALAVDSPGEPPSTVRASLGWPVADADLVRALVRGGYHVPASDELLGIRQTLMRLVNGNAAITAELVTSLLATAESDLAQYQRQCADRNWPDAGSRAHRLAGGARMTGCGTLVALCSCAETLCAQGDLDGLLALNALLVPGVERFCAALRVLNGQAATAA